MSSACQTTHDVVANELLVDGDVVVVRVGVGIEEIWRVSGVLSRGGVHPCGCIANALLGDCRISREFACEK